VIKGKEKKYDEKEKQQKPNGKGRFNLC